MVWSVTQAEAGAGQAGPRGGARPPASRGRTGTGGSQPTAVPLQPWAQGPVRVMPLTEEPLAPFGTRGPCGEGQGVSWGGPFPPGPRQTRTPTPCPSLGPSSAPTAPPRDPSLHLLHREWAGGGRSPTRRPVLWASAQPPPPSREIAAQAAEVRSNRGRRPREALTWKPQPSPTALTGPVAEKLGPPSAMWTQA